MSTPDPPTTHLGKLGKCAIGQHGHVAQQFMHTITKRKRKIQQRHYLLHNGKETRTDYDT